MMTSTVADAVEREMRRLTGGPAFPSLLKNGGIAVSEGGLTKREYMATAILAGLVANAGGNGHALNFDGFLLDAQAAVAAADALLAELAK